MSEHYIHGCGDPLGWGIVTGPDAKVSEPCTHSTDTGREMLHRRYQVPAVVIAHTQGGHDFTVICVECLKEAIAELNL